MGRIRRLLPYIVLALLIAANGLLWTKRDALADWWVLRGYLPPPAVVALANQDQLTDLGRHLLYINHPKLEAQAEFNVSCTNQSEHSVVLGCYKGDRLGIHLYKVTDPRLAGVEQVTLAHEMLHQAYDRLSTDERKKIDASLEKFAAGLTDQALLDKLDLYRKTEPDAVTNEMHSIFGTEVGQLPADLETYYRRYFKDRAAVVGYSGKYQTELTSRQQQVKTYEDQLASLNRQLDSNRAELDTTSHELTSERKRLDTLRSANPELYNSQYPAYNAKLQRYRELATQTKQLVDQYNGIVVKRNALSVEQQQLQDALDSHYSSTP